VYVKEAAIMFRLQFDKKRIRYWGERYSYPNDPNGETERKLQREVRPRVRRTGYFTKRDFLTLCDWKTPRARRFREQNEADFIKEVTQTALSTPSERLRIEVLTLLRGVGWPTASALLHFGAQKRYPILDVRALWSVGVKEAPAIYDFDLWWAYTQYCRQVAESCGVSMRKLDRALWQYSKENQGLS